MHSLIISLLQHQSRNLPTGYGRARVSADEKRVFRSRTIPPMVPLCRSRGNPPPCGGSLDGERFRKVHSSSCPSGRGTRWSPFPYRSPSPSWAPASGLQKPPAPAERLPDPGLPVPLHPGRRRLSQPDLPCPSGTLPARTALPARPTTPEPYFVRETSGEKASGIVYARPAGTEPRLAWAASGTYIREKGILLVERTPLSLPKTWTPDSISPLPGFRELRTWYLGLGSENPVSALAAAAGMAALICGLWPLSRLFRWSLVGTFAVLASFVLLGPLYEVFRSAAVSDLAGLVGIRVPHTLLVGLISGACGLALVFLDFALCPSLSGPRRNRGRPR